MTIDALAGHLIATLRLTKLTSGESNMQSNFHSAAIIIVQPPGDLSMSYDFATS